MEQELYRGTFVDSVHIVHRDGGYMDLITLLTIVAVAETVILIVEPFIIRYYQKMDKTSDKYEEKFRELGEVEKRLFNTESKLDSLGFLIQWVKKVGEDKAIEVFESQRTVQK